MKIVYNIVKSLRPYFFSLREIKEDVSLDIKIPVSWKYGDFSHSDSVPFTIKKQDQKETFTLISLIAPATVEGYEVVFKNAKSIITTNKEEEEKVKLFNKKVEELKQLFLSSPLDKLKDISFEKDVLRNTESVGEIELGDTEGSSTDRAT